MHFSQDCRHIHKMLPKPLLGKVSQNTREVLIENLIKCCCLCEKLFERGFQHDQHEWFLNAVGFVKSYLKEVKTTPQSLSWTRTLTSSVWLVKMNWYVLSGIKTIQFHHHMYQSIFNHRTWARLLRLTGGRRKEMLQRFKNQESTYSWPLFENQPQCQHICWKPNFLSR